MKVRPYRVTGTIASICTVRPYSAAIGEIMSEAIMAKSVGRAVYGRSPGMTSPIRRRAAAEVWLATVTFIVSLR